MEPVYRKTTPGSGPVADGRESGVVVSRESRKHARRVIELGARVSTLEAVVDPKTRDSFYVLTEARTLDIGEAGAGLKVDDPVATGQRVMVELELPDGSVLSCRASVRWTARDVDSYYVGLCFDESVPDLPERLAIFPAR